MSESDVMDVIGKLREDAMRVMNAAGTDWEQGYASGVMAAVIYIEATLKYGGDWK